MTVDLVPAIAGKDRRAYRAALDAFTRRQLDAFAGRIASLKTREPETFDEVMAAVGAADPRSVERVLTAPVVTKELRTSPRGASGALARDIATHLLTERGIVGEAPQRWTALGDTVVGPSGVRTPVAVADLHAVDVLSPQALSINAVTALREPHERSAPGEGSVRAVAALLEEAMARLGDSSPALHDLVRTCVLSVVVSEDPSLRFSSSTHGLYVGRVTLGAGHWPEVAVESVVDALVHEAIHCLLLMLDQDRPLLTDDLRADELPPVRSPWTGNPLPVPTYVHAVMVWFGLSHLWASALARASFPSEVADRMLRRASRGFRDGDVLAELHGASALISEHTLHALATMQHDVQQTILR